MEVRHNRILVVPQGSVLGPLLSNLMYDGVLRLVLPKGVKIIIGFADDIVVVSDTKTYSRSNKQQTSQPRLADQKTGLILVTGRKIPETMTIQVCTSQREYKIPRSYDRQSTKL